MTAKNWLCGARSGLGLGLLTVGMVFGPATGALADPAASPTPTPVGASAPTSTVAASAPPATVTAQGGAAAGTATAQGTSASQGTSAAQGTAAAPVSGDVIDQLAQDYGVGAGGGQVSNLLKSCLKLRTMGFKPSKANLEEIQQAMTYRPNQNPLINALKDTIAYQSKLKGQMEILQHAQAGQNANSAVRGAGQMPGASNPGTLPGMSAGSAPAAEVPSAATPVTP